MLTFLKAPFKRRDHSQISDEIEFGRRYEAQLRSVQLDETLVAAQSAVVVPLSAGLALTVLFWGSVEHNFILSILAATAILSGGACFAAKLLRSRVSSKQGVALAGGIAIAIATAMGAIWGAVPIVLFARSDSDGRLVILAAVAGVIANCYRLGSLRMICAFYVAPICLGGFVGLATSGSSGALILALLLPLYGWLVATHCERINALSAPRIIDRIRVAEQNETIQSLLLDFDENTSDWLWRTDDAGRFVDVSERFGAAVGLAAKEIEGAAFGEILTRFGAFPATKGARAVLATFAARKPFRNQLIEIKIDGASCWWRISGRTFYGADGSFLGYQGVGSDMTGARNSESRIAYLANFDGLTGFANRANFQSYAARQCEAAIRDGHCRALLFIDLDGFKGVNDNFGHEAGDEVLKQVAARLQATAPADAFTARLGGDEFALWLQATPVKAKAVAGALIEALKTPFAVNGLTATIGASIGIAFAPKHSNEPDSLMVKADIALYRAKAEGKGRVCLFREEFEAALVERRKLEDDLKRALARSEFQLHYQPQIDASDGAVVGFEALIRWFSPERGFVPPADFVPAAESTGLIGPIGRWVLYEACRTAALWPNDIHVAVNVSPAQVRSADFMQTVVMALKTSGLHPSRLEIEVTEGVFLDSSPEALENLRTLRTRGVRVALDDFGTGYSSLSYLVAFPVDRIKIDRSFIRDLTRSSANQAIVDAILALAKTLSIKLTAEGVETTEQALFLKRHRCDDLQGFLFGRPCPDSDVEDMIVTAPERFRQAIPMHMESPLALVLEAHRKQAVG